jgi:branched-chain amino acid transport system substrate-binding protein
VDGDTGLDPARASAVAKTFHANPDVLAVVGPARSREVLAVAPVFMRPDRLPFISGSAIDRALTNGSIPNFFRVVPNDSVQAPTIARYLRRGLKANDVFIVDDQSAYSKALAKGVEWRLKAGGVNVTRASVSQRMTDFSTVVTSVGSEIDVVFLPWQIAASAQIFGQQLKKLGSDAVIVGSDGLDSRDFKLPGSYVSAFAPDIRQIAGNASFVAGYGAGFTSNFGPPLYVATQAAILAIRKACADGDATRAEVQRNLRATFIPKIVLGGSLRFTARGERKDAKFSIFRIGPGGRKVLVG